jgi:hypothetical protein
MGCFAIGEHREALSAGKPKGRCYRKLTTLQHCISSHAPRRISRIARFESPIVMSGQIAAGVNVNAFPAIASEPSASTPLASFTPTTISARFQSLSEAKQTIEAWRQKYNVSLPHRALADRTPTEFASQIAVNGYLTEPKTDQRLSLQLV